jgi:hypothetical protein
LELRLFLEKITESFLPAKREPRVWMGEEHLYRDEDYRIPIMDKKLEI